MVDVVPRWYRPLCGFGVTGTNGKTSTALFLNAVLARVGATVAVTTVGLFASRTRLPYGLSAATMDRALRELAGQGGKLCVLELSSEALARGFTRKYPVRYGTFTNLSHDHLDAHVTKEHYLASKAQLFLGLPSDGAAILNAADPASTLLQEVIPKDVRVVRYYVPSRGAQKEPAEWSASRVTVDTTGTTIELNANEWFPSGQHLRIRGIGDIYAENALAALATAVIAGIEPSLAVEALTGAELPPGRFELLARAPLVVLDYAHTPDALGRTLHIAKALCRGRLAVVFGAGGERDRLKRPLMGQAARTADTVWLTNDNPRSEEPRQIVDEIARGLDGHRAVHVELDRATAIRCALASSAPDDGVVVAGRGHEVTQQLGHETRTAPDRDAILQSLRELAAH